MSDLNLNNLHLENERISPCRTSSKVRFLTADDLLLAEHLSPIQKTRIALESLEVEGLLSFGVRTSFEFGQLNILVGPNGSGKSNLLNCIRILRLAPLEIHAAFDSTFEEWLYQGEIDGETLSHATLGTVPNLPSSPESVIHHLRLYPQANSRVALEELIAPGNMGKRAFFSGSYRRDGRLSVVGPGSRVRIRVLNGDNYDPFSSILSQIRDASQYPEITRLATLYSQFRIYSEWTFGRDSVLRRPTPANRSTTVLSEDMSDLALVLNGLGNSEAHDSIKKLLRELKQSYVDYNTRIIFGRVGLELDETPFNKPLPAARLSDGTLRFLALAAILFQPQPPPLICLEEPELGMHPDMIRMVGEMIVDASKRSQLIITTHSEYLLTVLQDDFDMLFAFDSGSQGSEVTKLTKEEYHEWRSDHNLGKLWTSGEIGGVRY